MPETTDAELAEQLATLRRKMVAAATDEATPEQRAAWKAFDEEMARRIHRARPGVPLHHAFATLETLRAIQRYEAAGAAPVAVPSAPADRSAILREAATAIDHLRATMLAPPVADRYASGLTRAAGELRRMADEATAEHHTVDGVRHLCHTGDHYCPNAPGPGRVADEAQQPAPYPPETSWQIETRWHDGAWRSWAVRTDHDEAVAEFERAKDRKHAWRLVRFHTTTAVEAEHTEESTS